MSKICPKCKYPNLDKAEKCFKCGTDITEQGLFIANEQAREEAREKANERLFREQEASRLKEERLLSNNHQINNSQDNNINFEFKKVETAIELAYNGIIGVSYLCFVGCLGAFIYGILLCNNSESSNGISLIIGSIIYTLAIITLIFITKAIKVWLINIAYNLNLIRENFTNNN